MLLRVYDGKEIAYRSKTVVPSPNVKRLPPQGIQSVVQLGLRANWQQFTLLVIVNAFVGGMVGLERSTVPLLGHQEFGLSPLRQGTRRGPSRSGSASVCPGGVCWPRFSSGVSRTGTPAMRQQC